MMLYVNKNTLEELLHHAAAAARLVGHIDAGIPDAVVAPLGDHIDAIAHDLGELLGDPSSAVTSGLRTSDPSETIEARRLLVGPGDVR